jgi:hypothetical protein
MLTTFDRSRGEKEKYKNNYFKIKTNQVFFNFVVINIIIRGVGVEFSPGYFYPLNVW